MFSRTFKDRSRQLGLPPIPLHDLRHGWATLALEAAVHPKVVQERLGHANVGITLGVYSYVSAGWHQEAADSVAGVVFRTTPAARQQRAFAGPRRPANTGVTFTLRP